MAFDRRPLLQNFFRDAHLSEDDLAGLEKYWTLKHFPKKSFLTEAGMTERYFYIVVQGLQTIYLID